MAGGGARNLTMLRMLRERLAPATVEAADALGWSADAIEAQAFGFLAARGFERPAAELSRDHGRADPDDRRGVARP